MTGRSVFLILPCVFQAVIAGELFVHVGNSNPVRVGGTATFTCSHRPLGTDSVDRIFWSAHDPSFDLTLVPDTGHRCMVQETTPSLAHYTFKHTCNTATNRYTLSIVNVTASDINVNNTWCCEVQYGHFGFSGYSCGLIVKDDAVPMPVQPLATVPKKSDSTTIRTPHKKTALMSTTSTMSTAENYASTRTAVVTPAALNGGSTVSRLSAQFFGSIIAVYLWLAVV